MAGGTFNVLNDPEDANVAGVATGCVPHVILSPFTMLIYGCQRFPCVGIHNFMLGTSFTL